MISTHPTLLITDDDRAVRETLARVFERHGLAVRVAEHGEEAIRIATESNVHVVLMDLHMPRISGLETVRQLRKHDEQLPCILITGSVNEGLDLKAAAVGIRTVLAKPLNVQEAVECVHKVLAETYDWHPSYA